MSEKLSCQGTMMMRRRYIGKSCKLHYEGAPLMVTRASKQYMYDDMGNEFLDCINNVAHVGHCHPHVVAVGQEQMGKLTTSNGFLSETLSLYAKSLVETLPECLCVCFFVNSGSEANDLALRLARDYTKHKDVVVIDNAFHGNSMSLINISPLRFKNIPNGKKKHVHVVPTPDTFRGIYREDTPNPGEKYAYEAKKVIDQAQANGRQIAAFMSESVLSQCGVIVPPKDYLSKVYRCVREAGGVCIADEIQVGLGRVGDHYWGFQSYDVIPDIVTCGKPLGNGQPMAVVVTSREIAEKFGEFSSAFGGNPVSCAIGLAVLDVIRNEQLMSSAKFVGRILLERFCNIMDKHPMIGQVRGQGMVVGVEIVTDKESRKPAKKAAELLAYKMKEAKILIANDGPEKNVMVMLPPLCFNVENAQHVVETFDKCLTEIENEYTPDGFNGFHHAGRPTQLNIPLDILSGITNNDDDVSPSSKCPKCDYDDVD